MKNEDASMGETPFAPAAPFRYLDCQFRNQSIWRIEELGHAAENARTKNLKRRIQVQLCLKLLNPSSSYGKNTDKNINPD
jgi:hypothetical protein